jgi:hypothetical protein
MTARARQPAKRAVMKRVGKRPILPYTTQQIDIGVGEQLRITAGRETVFVYRDNRGLHVSKGGYATPPRAKKER